jgi:hypothetical protein
MHLVCDWRAVPLRILADAAARLSGPVLPAQPKRRNRGYPAEGLCVTPFSIGCRSTFRTCRRNSGHSSGDTVPYWASEALPGMGWRNASRTPGRQGGYAERRSKVRSPTTHTAGSQTHCTSLRKTRTPAAERNALTLIGETRMGRQGKKCRRLL